MLEIVLCTDENYVMPTAVLMTSIGLTNPNLNIHYNIVYTKLGQKFKNQLSRHLGNTNSSISFYSLDESCLKDCPIRPGEHVSLATYIRLFLPSILPQNIDKILYIDGDVICTDSIQDLWETPLANYAAAAVPDMRSNDIRILNRLSLPKDSDYFNAGIMLINLKWWRENDIQNKTLHYIANNKDICQYHDQDALNVLLHGQIAELPIRYNLQEHFFEPLENQFISRSHFEELQTALFNPSLIHYTGFRKPWHRECVNPLKSVWLFFYNKTEWRNTKLGFRHKGFRLFKYRLREKIANYGLMTSKNIYKDMDFSDIQQAVMNNVKSRVK